MKPRKISTDRDGARALRRLMRSDPSPQRLRPATVPQQSGVTVEIVSEIAAGDYSQHQAKLLTMQGGQLQETGNTVLVRHIGESVVPAGTRAIVEPCGRLGLCFSRTDNGRPEVGISLQRLTKAVGPQSNYFGDEDLTWTYQPAYTYPINHYMDRDLPGWSRNGHWKADGPFSEPYDSIDDPLTVPRSTVPWTAKWNRKLQPFRWEISPGVDGSAPNWRGWQWSWQRSEHWWGPGSRYNWLIYPGTDYGPSGTTLGPNSHLWPMTLDSLDLSLYGHWCFERYAFRSYVYTYGCQMDCRAYRVWIDGVDVTGVVSGPFTIGQPETGRDRRTPFIAGTHIEAAVTAAQHQSKSIQWDVWLNATFTLQGTTRDFSDNPITTATDQPMIFSHEFGAGGFTRLKSANVYQQINQGKVWDVTFNGVTVGGLSKVQNIDNEPTWYWRSKTGTDDWTFDVSADEVYFRWWGEIPIFIVYIDSAAFPADDWWWGGEFIYAPADSGDYTGHQTHSGFRYTPGVWNVDAATTFVPIGGVGYAPDHLWLDPQRGVGYRDQLPSSITVEPA